MPALAQKKVNSDWCADCQINREIFDKVHHDKTNGNACAKLQEKFFVFG
jgi:hypothetical protein